MMLRAFYHIEAETNGRHFADAIFKRIFLNESVWISLKISLKFVPKGPINNIPALVQIMAWRRPGDKPLYEPMMVSLLTHICVTRPWGVKHIKYYINVSRCSQTWVLIAILKTFVGSSEIHCVWKIYLHIWVGTFGFHTCPLQTWNIIP